MQEVFRVGNGSLIKVVPLTNLFFPGLTRLIIEAVPLVHLTSAFCSCVSLIRMHITKCQLVTVSPAIGNLVHLKTLNLQSNNLQSLPKSIKQLSLEKLYLDYNRLKSIPTCSTFCFLANKPQAL